MCSISWSSGLLGRNSADHLPRSFQSQSKSACHGGLRDYVELETEMDDCLRYLRADTADDAVGSHQARRLDGFDQVLRNQGVDRGNSGDINDGDFCPRLRYGSAGSP